MQCACLASNLSCSVALEVHCTHLGPLLENREYSICIGAEHSYCLNVITTFRSVFWNACITQFIWKLRSIL